MIWDFHMSSTEIETSTEISQQGIFLVRILWNLTLSSLPMAELLQSVTLWSQIRHIQENINQDYWIFWHRWTNHLRSYFLPIQPQNLIGMENSLLLSPLDFVIPGSNSLQVQALELPNILLTRLKDPPRPRLSPWKGVVWRKSRCIWCRRRVTNICTQREPGKTCRRSTRFGLCAASR